MQDVCIKQNCGGGSQQDTPVHVLSPSSWLLDVGRAILVPLNVVTLESVRRLAMKENKENSRNITLVDPKPVIPMIADISSSSLFTASISSPSSASPSSSVRAGVNMREVGADDCPGEVLRHSVNISRRREATPCNCVGFPVSRCSESVRVLFHWPSLGSRSSSLTFSLSLLSLSCLSRSFSPPLRPDSRRSSRRREPR